MFRASSAHLQEGTAVHVQHMVLSLSVRVLGGLSVHSLSEKFGMILECFQCGWKEKHYLANPNIRRTSLAFLG